jgi:uncharacterized protein (DUF1330 family)
MKARALVQKHGGKVLTGAGSAMEILEGDRQLPSYMVLLEFPSMEQAKAWYHDPEYALLITLRQSGASTDNILVDELQRLTGEVYPEGSIISRA